MDARALEDWGIYPSIEHQSLAPSLPAALEACSPKIIFTGIDAVTYNELIDGIQVRLGELGIRQVDSMGRMPSQSGHRQMMPTYQSVKRLGPEKLFDAIRAAGLKLRLEPDPEQLARMQKQIAENCQPRQAKQARMGNHSHPSQKLIDDVLSHLASKRGGLAQLRDAVKKARSNWARHAANALHAKTDQRFGNISPITPRALPPPRETRDPCAEQEATAA
jgi:hypothetical protein